MAKTIDKHINVWVNGAQVENNLKSIQQAIKHVTNQLKQSTVGSEEYIEASKKLKELKYIYEQHIKDLKSVSEETDSLRKKQNDFLIKLGAIGSTYSAASSAVRRFIGATQEYVEAYASMDDAMSAVQKTTGMTREEVEKLNSQLKNIDTRTSQEELLKIAEIGGRLGLAKGDIEAFTESVNVANVALGDSFGGGAEEIASVLGKIRGAFQQTKDADIGQAFNSIGSALNSVGASCAATEGNVAQFAQRLGALPDAMKPTIQDAIGLGAAFENASINAEVAATAYGQLMTKAASNLDAFAVAMGKPIEEVRELINTNPTEFMLQFAESFKGVPADQLGAKLKELKLNAVGVQEAIGAMSGQTEKFREILDVSNQAFADGTSMMEEYSTVNNNAAAQLEKAKKRMQETRVEIGEKLIPVVTKIYETLSSSASWISKNIALVKQMGLAIGAVVAINTAAIAKEKALVALSKTKNALTAIGNKLAAAKALVTSSVSLAQAKLTGNTLKAEIAQRKLNAAMAANPWGIILTAIIAVVAALDSFAKRTDAVTSKIAAAEAEANAAYIQEETRIKTLRKAIDDENTSRADKLKAIDELKRIIPDYFADLDDEGRLIRDNKTAIDEYLVSFRKKMQYQSMEKAYLEAESKYQELRAKADTEHQNYRDANIFSKAFTLLDRFTKVVVTEWTPGLENNGIIKKTTDKLLEEAEQERNVLKEKFEKMASDDYATAISSMTGGEQNGGGGSGSGGTGNSIKKQIDRFRKKIKDFFDEINNASLSEYGKARAEISRKIEELMYEAETLGLGNEFSDKLIEAQKKRLEKLTSDTLKKYSDSSVDVARSIDQIRGTDYADELQKKLTESDRRFDNISKTIEDNIKNLSEIYALLMASPTSTENELNAVYDAFAKAMQDKANLDAAILQERSETINDFYKQIEGFAISKEKEMSHASELAGKSEMERAEIQKKWRIATLEEEYDVQINLAEAALLAKQALNDGDTEGIKNIESLISKLKELKSAIGTFVENESSGDATPKKTGNPYIDLLNGSITDPKERFKTAVDALQDFANQATDIYRQIADSQRQSAEIELQKYEDAQDAKSKKLKEQLDNGIISQKYYDAQIEKMEKEREAKEKKLKHDQFENERKASIVEIVIQGAIAVARAFSEYGWPWGLIPAALSTAQTAAQAAIVGSQVNPYARGGFITKKQIALMGEEGNEWVASNMLLEDEKTAPIIAALEDYQRGNDKALEMMMPSNPDWISLSQSATKISSNFAPNQSPTVNNYYSTSAENTELLDEVKRMNKFLSDPKNRQAYISYRIQTESTTNRNFIKKASAL